MAVAWRLLSCVYSPTTNYRGVHKEIHVTPGSLIHRTSLTLSTTRTLFVLVTHGISTNDCPFLVRSTQAPNFPRFCFYICGYFVALPLYYSMGRWSCGAGKRITNSIRQRFSTLNQQHKPRDAKLVHSKQLENPIIRVVSRPLGGKFHNWLDMVHRSVAGRSVLNGIYGPIEWIAFTLVKTRTPTAAETESVNLRVHPATDEEYRNRFFRLAGTGSRTAQFAGRAEIIMHWLSGWLSKLPACRVYVEIEM